MKSPITTHILDTALGLPAEGVVIELYQQQGESFILLATGVTNKDGRVADLLPVDTQLPLGLYRMRFELEPYFKRLETTSFYPVADIVFKVSDHSHYHIPLLLSNHGYTTYRGS